MHVELRDEARADLVDGARGHLGLPVESEGDWHEAGPNKDVNQSGDAQSVLTVA